MPIDKQPIWGLIRKRMKKKSPTNANKWNMPLTEPTIWDSIWRLTSNGGEKSHKCNQCEYASYHAQSLKVHNVTHSGEKPYKCGQCEYTTSLLTSTRMHMKIHSGEKMHKCNQCEYASYHTGSLKLHLRNHSGEKPINCSQCDYTTAWSSGMRDHIMRHHRGGCNVWTSVAKYTKYTETTEKV